MIKRITIISVMVLGLVFLSGCEPGDTEDPTVSITQPADNAVVSGTVEIKATADDNEEVTKVEFYVDGDLKGTDNEAADSEYSYSWDASGETPGSSHMIHAKAYDAADNVGESSVITVTIAGGGGPTYHEGTISADETWYAADNPHIVTGDVEVEATLTLEPGVLVKFNAGTGLEVGYYNPGALAADGTADSTIIFTSNVSPAGPGNWNGIAFYSNTIDAVTVLNNCLVEYGGGNDYGNIHCYDASPTIKNCQIRHSSTYGVHSDEEGFTEFSGNTITSNAEYPLRIDAEDVRTIGLNTLTGNTKDGIEVGSGGISTSGEWLNQGVPYIITDDLEIGGTASPVLTIAPGNTLEFRAGVGIEVGYYSPGALMVDGSTNQITFTTSISPPAPGNWNGIAFYSNTIDAVTVLNNCLVEYGGGNDYGNIHCYDASPTIKNCQIRHSSTYGVHSDEEGFTEFSGNTITSNAEYPLRIDAEDVRTIGLNTLTGNTKDGIEVGSGGISTSGEWLNQGVPYIITDDLEIGGTASPVLTIAPGNTLEFRAGVGIEVGYYSPGALVADGSTGQITFTTSISPPAPGNWNGIAFYSNTIDGATKLNNCLVEYGGGNDYGNIYCYNASPTITNCAINYSLHWGIYLDGDSNPTMSGNTFEGNADGDVGP